MRKGIVSTSLLSLLALSGCEPKASLRGRHYTSQFGYTTQIDPRDLGMSSTSPESVTLAGITIFNEGFFKKPHAFLISRIASEGDGLENAYYKSVAIATSNVQASLNPGQGFRIVGEGKPSPISIDGMHGLRGGCELWRYKSQEDLFNERFTSKESLKIQVMRDEPYLYVFTFMSGNNKDSNFAFALDVYERFTGSFKRPK